VNFYGTRPQIIAEATTIQVEIFTNWGRKNQKSRKLTLASISSLPIVFL